MTVFGRSNVTSTSGWSSGTRTPRILKRYSISTVLVAFLDGKNRHFFAFSTAPKARSGWPKMTRASEHVPSGRIAQRTCTVPWTLTISAKQG